MDHKFHLIFHIGAGKTGTSSIQASLRNGQSTLQEFGIEYWGLMLEFAPEKLYEWQAASASKQFLELEKDNATKQVQTVLEESINNAIQRGIHTAIWSNEWFFGRHENVIPALKMLEIQGIHVDIIAYVRRHDAWAKSAYVQWGLKHKTYSGSLLPFKQYIKKRPVRFTGTLTPWAEAFSENFLLRNFDVAGDAVQDFIKTLNLPASLPSVRVNEAPGAEELLLRALYNNNIQNEAAPVEFDRRFQTKSIDFNLKPKTWLAGLLPEPNDLQDVIADSAIDFDAINNMLKAAGQPPLENSTKHQKASELDFETLSAILIQMLFRQSNKIQKIQNQVNRLEKLLSDSETPK